MTTGAAMNGGVLGTLVGLTSATVAIGFNVWLRRRHGDPEPLRSVLGLRPEGVERAIHGLASKVAFPVYAVIVASYLLAQGDSTTAGILAGCAGATYGLSSAWAATRLGQ
jgi:hypothetical protein